jgi:HEAT repeat protein
VRQLLMFLVFAMPLMPGMARGQESVASLVKKLASQDSADRQRAADELAKMGPDAAKAAKALERLLEDTEGGVRMSAADALGKIGKAAVPFVKRALANRDRQIAGLRAAGHLGPLAIPLLPAITKCWLIETAESSDAIDKCLRQIGPSTLPHLIKCLNDHAINVSVCRTLRDMGKSAQPAVPALIQLLEKRGVDAPVAAAEALGMIGDPAAVPGLLAAIHRGLAKIDITFADTAGNAMRSLGQIRAAPDTVVPVLLQVLACERRDDDFIGMQSQAILALEAFDVRTPLVLTSLREFLAAAPGKNKESAQRVLKVLGG